MSLDDLIPFIIFLVIIAFNIFKSLAKKKLKNLKKEPALKNIPKKKAFGLSKLVDTIKAELELAGLKPEEQQSKTQIPAADAESDHREIWDARFEDDDLEAIMEEETAGHVQVQEIRSKLSMPARINGNRKKPVISGLPFDTEKRRQKIRLKLSKAKLREAIVMSEILARPLGLREEPFHLWEIK